MITGVEFAVAGEPVDPVVSEIAVAADPVTVFRAITDPVQISQWLGVESNVELRIGGPYELYFLADAPPGTRGSEGCVILSYVPGEMLSFSWNSPPEPPLDQIRGSHTWVVIDLEPAGDGTRLRLVHTGMGVGEVWDANRRYFERAWGMLLARLAASFEA